MENKEFFLPIDGTDIHMKLEFPETMQDHCSLVIIVHGLTGHMEERHIIAAAETIRSIGLATLRVDMYGHGSSGGDFFNHTMLRWQQELVDIIDYASRLDFVDRLYLTGHSQGGACIILGGAIMQDKLTAIIPQAPATSLKCEPLEFPLGEISKDGTLPDSFLLYGDKPLSTNYLRVNRYLNYEESARNFKKPALVIHSETDDAVPYRFGKAVAEQFPNGRLVTIPNDDHCFNAHLDMVCDAIAEFLREMEAAAC